jgi:hypothetical protein
MKRKNKSIASPRTAAFLTGIIFCLATVGTLPAFGFFEDDIKQMVEDNDSERVEGVTGLTGNGRVTLLWSTKFRGEEQATKYRIEYGLESVQDGTADAYTNTIETPEDLATIRIDELTNDQTYYFTVIAVFADGSETPPSNEVSIRPSSEVSQSITETPVVVSAEAVSKYEIIIYFSKKVLLPDENPELAFTVTEEDDEETELMVEKAEYVKNDNDENQESEVMITLEVPQQAETNYTITASARITDFDSKPIESGSTDSAVIDGYDGDLEYLPTAAPIAEEPPAEEPAEAPAPIVEPVDEPTEEPDDTEDPLDDILNELINTSDFDAPIEDVVIDPDDTTPPADITNLTTNFRARMTDFLVTLNWTRSASNDLDDQIFYRSTNEGDSWDGGRSLGAEATSTTSAEQPETDITYKISSRDAAGNESVGLIRSLSLPALPATGPGLLIPFGLALTAAGIRRLRKK